ncbi:hypothetical protein TrLO_g3580 [Triparma laevis f. longispina]|uniref:J domain-containing protein n=1 Tax=Triparma laevis f. longispina TaxID=1714387 RepID=A0A9W7DR32_9STRA|nr:hypothetical protein TrLO_g3580 [Triparma laevis f. longispina]
MPVDWNPYDILEVRRDASDSEIKKSYRLLSKKYHSDAARFSPILPGSCNNLEDVELHFDNIKKSYEILSSHTQRLRYDRYDLMSNPSEALGRAFIDGVGFGVGVFAKGFFMGGMKVVEKLGEREEEEVEDEEKTKVPFFTEKSATEQNKKKVEKLKRRRR